MEAQNWRVQVSEAAFQSKLLRALRQRLPDAVIYKLNDNFTRGIPDIMISYQGRVNWFELKVWPNAATKIQWESLRRLWNGYLITMRPSCYWVQHVVTAISNREPEFIVTVWHFTDLVKYLEMIVRNE